MPKNHRESLIYTVLMCFVMVLWMSRIGPEDVNNKQEPPFLRRLLFFVRTETPPSRGWLL